MAKKTFSIRAYRDGDEKQINTLFNEVFATDGRPRELEEWYWKFRQNPAKVVDVSDYATLVEADGKVVGQYAIWYVNFKYKDQIVRTGHPVDNIIHPDYRISFRIQLEMFKRQIEVASKENVKFGFGFPNEAAYLVGKKLLGYKDIGDLATLSIRLNFAISIKRRFPFVPFPFLALLRYIGGRIFKARINRAKNPSKLVVEEITRFGTPFEEFWQEVSLYYPLTMVKDRTYMNWRYKEKPGEKYKVFIAKHEDQIKGCIVLKIADDTIYYPGARVGYVMELLSLPENGVSELLLRTALHLFAAAGVDFSVAVICPEDFLYDSFLSVGFSSQKNLQIHKMVYKIYARKEIDENLIKNPQNWHVSLGDLDAL